VVGETVYVSVIGPNIGTFAYNVKKGKQVWQNDQGEYNPVISDGNRIYLTGTSTVRAFEPRPPGHHGKKKGKGKGKAGAKGAHGGKVHHGATHKSAKGRKAHARHHHRKGGGGG
jgi:hypothetical protein